MITNIRTVENGVFATVTRKDRDAAIKWGVMIAPARYWFTTANWQSFKKETGYE